MKYVFVKEGQTVVSKEVYSGDAEEVQRLVDLFAANNPSLTYEEVSQDVFEETAIQPVLTQDQVDWQAAKLQGAEAANTFLAKKLGLE